MRYLVLELIVEMYEFCPDLHHGIGNVRVNDFLVSMLTDATAFRAAKTLRYEVREKDGVIAVGRCSEEAR